MSAALRAYGLIGVGALLLAWAQRASDPRPFERYFLSLEPLWVIAGATAVGGACLQLLTNRLGYASGHPGRPADRTALALWLGTAFAVPTVVFDFLRPFPRDINVPWPDSLCFYPAIALVVEALFHLLPLTALQALARRIPAGPWQGSARTAATLVVATLEPVFQLLVGLPKDAPWWTGVYLVTHLFAFNLAQLHLLRRHGFPTMYALRLAYYLHWHILWGHARLELLFG